MKLRNYKNVTSFQASQPWLYPAKRAFHPDYIFEHERDKANTSLKDYSSQYNDQSPERNQNLTLSILEKNYGVYHTTFWKQELRSPTKNSKINRLGKPPLAEHSIDKEA